MIKLTGYVITHRSGIQNRLMVSIPAHLLGIFLGLCLWAPLVGLAQDAAPRPLAVQVKDWQKSLDDTEKELAKPELSDARLAELRDRLAELDGEARSAAAAADPETRSLQSDLNALGPPPAQGAPPEAPNVVARRKELNEQRAAVEGAVKEADLVRVRAERLSDAIKAQRRTRFTERVLSRGEPPLAASVWTKALSELEAGWDALYGDVRDWAAGGAWVEQARGIGVGLSLAVLLAFPLRHWLIRRFGYIVLAGEPTYLQRLWAAVFTGMVRALLPTAAAAAVYGSLLYSDVLDGPAAAVAWTTLTALACLFFAVSFSSSALAPYEPGWRLAPIHDEGARAVNRTVFGLAVLFALDRVLNELASQYNAAVELVAVQKFVFGLLISAELLTLLRRRVWFREGQAELGGGWRRLRHVLTLLVAAIPLSALLGYVVLSRLLATQWVLTLGLYAAVALLRKVAAESVEHALAGNSPLARRVRDGFGLGGEGAGMLAFWLGGLAQALVLALGAAALLVLWGVAEKDIGGWLRDVFLGFRVGSVTVSPAGILLALGLFGGLLAATGTLQRTLDQHIFPKTRLDMGVRHSIRAGIGYLGFILATLFAVSSLGIDLSNLAIIAGALSVGIGFGLQNIVNNFVSGLILLVERPIKAGDLVVVGEHQGYVKKISVRATEITTFDRGSVFIPNSSLIAGPVMNRTYADKVGRVLMPVGVCYESDPRRVKALLLEAAQAHPEVSDTPPPSVFFRGLGANALNFELMAFLHDVDKVSSVTSDLYFAIHDAFQREGVRMPSPLQEVRVQFDDERLRRVLAGGHG